MTLSHAMHERPDRAADRQTGSLAGLAVTLLLVVVGLYLVDALRACAATQDCVLSGRSGCAVVTAP
jgi:hypothetical protein